MFLAGRIEIVVECALGSVAVEQGGFDVWFVTGFFLIGVAHGRPCGRKNWLFRLVRYVFVAKSNIIQFVY
ncbi:hypothetical protein D9M73_284860 [compost metagenome]